MKERIRRLLVCRVPGIRDRYEAFRLGRGRKRWQALGYLLWLNIQYYLLFRRSLGRPLRFPAYEEKRLSAKAAESSLAFAKSPEELADELAAYDVVCFDVFDTLLFRPFSEPADLFHLVGAQLNYPDFRRLRTQAEETARREKQAAQGTREVTLEEIWAVMEREAGIPRQTGLEAEWRCEQRCCRANPYMRRVVELLRGRGKPLAAVSDMYLGGARVRALLEQNGFGIFDRYFLSCDRQKSKYDDSLYPVVRESMGRGLRYAHVGDHPLSDGTQAERHGFHACLYPNVNRLGGRYRPEDMSAITGSIYRGIVNAHLYNGLRRYSREYEYGYVYGGLFAAGYCRFIHDYAGRHGMDKILFLSRDGAVLLEAYRRMYPEEAGKTAYAYWSRLAAAKLTASYFKADYFRRFLFHKAGQGFTLRQAVESMELDGMLPPLCRSLSVEPEEKLTYNLAGEVKEYLTAHWAEVLRQYQPQVEAGRVYYRDLLRGCRKAAAVDIGWAGSGAVTLDYAVNRLWGLDCPITGLLAGTNAAGSPEPDAGEPLLFSGKLASYLYSQQFNRDLWKFHDPGRGHNLYWELLLSAPEPGLKGFYPDGAGKAVCRPKDKAPDGGRIREIHAGILDFVQAFLETERRLGLSIPVSGRDAYAPMISACGDKNKRFWKEQEALMDDMHIG